MFTKLTSACKGTLIKGQVTTNGGHKSFYNVYIIKWRWIWYSSWVHWLEYQQGVNLSCFLPVRWLLPQYVPWHRGVLQRVPGQLHPGDDLGEHVQTKGGVVDRDRQGHQDLSVSNRNLTPLLFVCYFSLITSPTLYRLAPKHTSREVSNQLYKYSYPLITVAVSKGFRVLCRPSIRPKKEMPAALLMELNWLWIGLGGQQEGSILHLHAPAAARPHITNVIDSQRCL